MAFTFGFYDSVNHDRRYNAVQMSMIFDGIISDGVYATIGKCFIVKESSEENKVIVQPGRAWFNHTWNYNDADLPIDAPQSEIILDRWDALVIDINANEEKRLNDIIWVKGTPSSNPNKPVLINTLEHHQYPLCYILRKANNERITDADIENRVGTSECPFVTGILDTIDIDDLLFQWKDQWSKFISKYEKTYDDYFVDLQKKSDEIYNSFKNKIAEYLEELTSKGDNTLNGILNELLDFRNVNESSFLKWLEDMKEKLSQYPSGNILIQIQELQDNQKEILDMLISGDITFGLITEENEVLTDDVGNILLTDNPICKCMKEE